MKSCARCEQENPDDALFCHQCGTAIAADASRSPVAEAQLWRAFIGPSKAILFSLNSGWSWQSAETHYLETFRKFSLGPTPRFALTWHWSAFLFDPFLWFLYRKMYLYALVYAIGPVLSAYFTGDVTVGIVWRVMAGGSANYIYYWHAKDHLAAIRTKEGLDYSARERLLRDLGGVQPYVLWLGVALHVLLLLLVIGAIRGGPSEGGR
jgi:hypothetical protein